MQTKSSVVKLLLLLLFSPMLFSQIALADKAIFAAGCFWCIESDFEKVEGVTSVVSGYTGGSLENPSYKQVSKGGSGHYEVIQITYDPQRISYDELLGVFWKNIDPFDAEGQFCDRGDSYRAAIFIDSEAQRLLAETSKQKTEALLGESVVTPILNASVFYPAEDYHQDYAQKNPLRYNYYRWRCGRDQRLEEVWQLD